MESGQVIGWANYMAYKPMMQAGLLLPGELWVKRVGLSSLYTPN